jgi:hypothetical protein
MTDSYKLTDKAIFPESDAVALAELATALGLVMDFLDGLVRLANNDEEEAMNLWEVGRGLQAASEMYFLRKAEGEKAI